MVHPQTPKLTNACNKSSDINQLYKTTGTNTITTPTTTMTILPQAHFLTIQQYRTRNPLRKILK